MEKFHFPICQNMYGEMIFSEHKKALLCSFSETFWKGYTMRWIQFHLTVSLLNVTTIMETGKKKAKIRWKMKWKRCRNSLLFLINLFSTFFNVIAHISQSLFLSGLFIYQLPFESLCLWIGADPSWKCRIVSGEQNFSAIQIWIISAIINRKAGQKGGNAVWDDE